MSPRRFELVLWSAQRATAVLLAFFVAVHLATIIYAVRGGLTAAELLGRARSSLAWPAFYALFVVAASIHAVIGLRTVAAEWLGWRGALANGAAAVIGCALMAAGFIAVRAVAFP
jgi:succinate dehydrogenase subunit C